MAISKVLLDLTRISVIIIVKVNKMKKIEEEMYPPGDMYKPKMKEYVREDGRPIQRKNLLTRYVYIYMHTYTFINTYCECVCYINLFAMNLYLHSVY